MNPCSLASAVPPSEPSGPDGSPPTSLIPLSEAAGQLGSSEHVLRGWLTAFNVERTYDCDGQLLLGERDVAFLRVVSSLREVDRSCDSIVRLISEDPAIADLLPPAVQAPLDAEPRPADLAQKATLTAALRELHASSPRRPFWKFWQAR